MSTETFHQWIKRYSIDKSSPSSITHISLRGGKYHITDDFEFAKRYSRAVQMGEKLYIVEQKKSVFKYMIDLDITDVKYWDMDRVLECVTYIQSVVFRVYNNNHNVLVCMSPEKVTSKGVKTGVHLIWPSIFVDSERALMIRDMILESIPDSMVVPQVSWKDVFDACIYRSNGFRMLYSDKFENRKDSNRVYTLRYVMNSSGECADIQYKRLINNIEDLIVSSSIRCMLHTEIDMCTPWNIPYRSMASIKCVSSSCSVGSTSSSVSVSSECFDILLRMVNTCLPSQYRNVVKDIRQYPNGNYLITANSRYCLNMDGYHNSCGIYFIATQAGVAQKCLCPCDKLDRRIYGYCRDFTSVYFSYPDDSYRRILFPERCSDNSSCSVKSKQSVGGGKKVGKSKPKMDKVYYGNLNFDGTNPKEFIENYRKMCHDMFLKL